MRRSTLSLDVRQTLSAFGGDFCCPDRIGSPMNGHLALVIRLNFRAVDGFQEDLVCPLVRVSEQSRTVSTGRQR